MEIDTWDIFSEDELDILSEQKSNVSRELEFENLEKILSEMASYMMTYQQSVNMKISSQVEENNILLEEISTQLLELNINLRSIKDFIVDQATQKSNEQLSQKIFPVNNATQTSDHHLHVQELC